MPGIGGCDFTPDLELIDPLRIPWTAQALPSVVALVSVDKELATTNAGFASITFDQLAERFGPERIVLGEATGGRVHVESEEVQHPAVLLPLDQLFEVRMVAALRLWRSLNGRNPGRDSAALSKARRDRLILGLRALDGRSDGASYREIAASLFGLTEEIERSWKTHDLRDRTIRLVRFGSRIMKGGYRQLLMYPYRRCF